MSNATEGRSAAGYSGFTRAARPIPRGRPRGATLVLIATTIVLTVLALSVAAEPTHRGASQTDAGEVAARVVPLETGFLMAWHLPDVSGTVLLQLAATGELVGRGLVPRAHPLAAVAVGGTVHVLMETENGELETVWLGPMTPEREPGDVADLSHARAAPAGSWACLGSTDAGFITPCRASPVTDPTPWPRPTPWLRTAAVVLWDASGWDGAPRIVVQESLMDPWGSVGPMGTIAIITTPVPVALQEQ